MAGRDDDTPGSLTRSEIKGFLEGPFLYLSSRRSNRLAPLHPADEPEADATAQNSADAAPASSEERGTPEGNTSA